MVNNDHDATEWYRKYRPRNLREVIGQEEAVHTLKEKLVNNQLEHVIMLTGPSGVGKTTLARIIKSKLNCHELDFEYIACARVDGLIDTVRAVVQKAAILPLAGPCRVFLFDEIQATSKSNAAQQALLDILEDTPRHVYFLLCTTNPEKLLKTIRNRCTTIELKSLAIKDLEQVLRRVIEAEGVAVTEPEINQLAVSANGCARWAVNELQRISALPAGPERVKAIRAYAEEETGAELCRLMMDPKSTWKEVARVLNDDTTEMEELRRGILNYAGKVLITTDNKSMREWAYSLITRLEIDPFNCLKPVLAAACYDIFSKRA